MSLNANKNKNYQVSEFSFQSFDSFDKNVKDFEFQDLREISSEPQTAKEKISSVQIREEREAAAKSKFEINPVVKELRGISNQEKKDFETKVNVEVLQRVEVQKIQAVDEGFQEGLQRGQEQAYLETKEMLNQKIVELSQIIDSVKAVREEAIKSEKDNIYKMVKSLTKWVALKEVSDEGYLPKLLEKLIYEINQKANLVVKVNANNFEQMDGVVEQVEQRLGELSNVRIEIDHDLTKPGIILESENGIIDGSFDSQMASIDKVFETVGIIDDQS